VLCILAGVARLGFVTELLSKPIRYGYMNGIALTVLISQLPKLFGFSVDADDPLHKLWAFVAGAAGRQDQRDALLVGGGTLALILLLKRSKRLPGVLIAVIGATVLVATCSASTNARRVGPRRAAAGPAGLRHPVDHARPMSCRC
jgi:MFS superfamily sulfate permease-like transporter